MRDWEDLNGSCSAHPAQPKPQGSHSMGEHARRIHRDAATLAAEVRGTTVDAQRYLADRVKRHPYSTLGTAAGIGYVLGGGLGSRLTVVLVGAATRLATALAVRELGVRILRDDAAAPVQNKDA